MFPQLLEETILNLGEFHGHRALRVVIHDAVDPSTDAKASHQSSVVGLQHLRDCLDIGHSRIEPQVVTISVEDDRHTVVNGGCHPVRSRRQDTAGFDPLPALVFPAIPDSCEREQFAVIDLRNRTAALPPPSPAIHRSRPQESGTYRTWRNYGRWSNVLSAAVLKPFTDASHDLLWIQFKGNRVTGFLIYFSVAECATSRATYK